MSRLLWLLLLLTACANAQVVGAGFVNYVTSAPSGTCSQSEPQRNVIGLGTVYTCQSGTWTQVGSGGGGGNISGTLTSGLIPVASGAHALSNGSISDNGSGTVSWAGTLALNPLVGLVLINGVTGEADFQSVAINGTGNCGTSTGICWSAATGSPEGVLTAKVGSLYSQTDVAATPTLWLKDNGVSNTGWQQVLTSASTVSALTSFGNSPTLVTPTIGVATATSINKMAVTAPATSSTLAVADGKTLTASNTLTIAGTDSTTMTFPGISGKPWAVISASVANSDTVACPNNTTANFATTYTIPANYLVANKILKITLGFAATSSASPPTSSFRLTIGGTSVFVGGTQATQASLTGQPFTISFIIQGSAAAGASVATYTHPLPAYAGAAGNSANPFQNSTTQVAQPVNLATNGTLVVQPILFCGANTAGNSTTLQQFIVESD